MRDPTRRRLFLKASIGAVTLAAAGGPSRLRAATGIPIADAHSHIHMFSRQLTGWSLKSQMQSSGVALLSWNIVGDQRWIAATSSGIQQRSTPAAGEQASFFRDRLAAVRRLLAADGLAPVQRPADIDAARSGTPHVVIAVEGAGFAADGLEQLDQFHADGLRQLQLVHYVRNALGDFQTERPEHDGLTALGVDLIAACNRLGILVDLAHATEAVIDRALQVSTVPMIWSHSAITSTRYSWRQAPHLSRRLYIDSARKIARAGGAIGLWSLRSSAGSSPAGYADELLRMVDAVGADHVMFGTDLDGVGRNGVMDDLADLRQVADLLQARGVDDRLLNALCFDNYARCLAAAMKAGRKTL